MILPMDTVPLPMVRARPVPCAAEAGRGRWVAAEWNGQPATNLLAGLCGLGTAHGLERCRWRRVTPTGQAGTDEARGTPPPPARARRPEPACASQCLHLIWEALCRARQKQRWR